MLGPSRTRGSVKAGAPVLETPPTAVTTTAPFAPDGTTAVTLLVVQLLNDVAGMVPNFTALPVPCAPCPGYTCSEFDAPECIRRVTVERVTGAVERVLSKAVTSDELKTSSCS